MIELEQNPTIELLIDYVDWNVAPKTVKLEDDEGNEQRVTQVQRKDGLWQTVPMAIDVVMGVYAFATFGRA